MVADQWPAFWGRVETDVGWPWRNFKKCTLLTTAIWQNFLNFTCIWVKITGNGNRFTWKFKKFCQIAVVSRVHFWNCARVSLWLQTRNEPEISLLRWFLETMSWHFQRFCRNRVECTVYMVRWKCLQGIRGCLWRNQSVKISNLWGLHFTRNPCKF